MGLANGRSRQSELDAFSHQAVRKAVFSGVLQSPLLLYPSAVGVLSLAALALLEGGPLLVGGALAGLGLGIGGAVVQLGFRRQHLARAYLERKHREVNNRRQQLLEELSADMEELGFIQGVRQLAQLQEKFDNFVAILNRTLDPEEITYGRYLGITEQVYLSGLDNLGSAVGALSSVRTIDAAAIVARIEDIHRDGVVTEAEAVEQQSLDERRSLLERQLCRVEQCIAENEQAMTQMDLTAAALAEMKVRSGQANMDMESAMGELHKLIERASLYNRPDEL